ncbi:MAG TPA: tetratricopeptide repeat protein [Gemmata sp.]
MSNPTDPNAPNPERPDPNAPNPSAPPGEPGSSDSLFEFQLPENVDSFGELPPIPPPDAGLGTEFALPPPAPVARDGSAVGFTTPGSRGSFGDFGLQLPPPPTPAAPELPPVEAAFALPELPSEPAPSEPALQLDPPTVPRLQPPLGLESADLLGLSNLRPPTPEPFELPEPPVAPAPEHEALAEIDLGDADLEAVPVATDAPAGFDEPIPVAEIEDVPLAEVEELPVAEVEELPVAEAEIDLADLPVAGDSAVALGEPVPGAEAPSSFTLGSAAVPPDVPVADLNPVAGAKVGSSGSVPDVGTLRPPAPPLSTGSTPELPTAGAGYRGGSSFEFQLPDDVNSYSELPPIREPDEIGSRGDFGVLPPRPTAGPRDASFDFINVAGERSFAEIDLGGKVAGPPAAPPPAPPLPTPQGPDSKVELGASETVQPASGWLDDDAPVQPVADADLLDLPVAGAVESSDIFAGFPVRTAEPVETSDVLSATAGAPPLAGAPSPPEPVRPSDVALTFNEPPDGSTVQDGDFSDLPLAEDAADSGTALARATDDESIHDAPALPAEHPLFDSGTLANSPDLPPDAYTDAPEYGAPPIFTPDASSILADLSTPDLGLDDASSVQVEAPGVGRTLTDEPNEAFELTVPEEPIPPGLFDDADDDGLEATNWEQQSGSDLLSGRTAAPDDGMVEPVDIDLSSDQPSLSSAPSSIFSGTKAPRGSGSGDSGAADLAPPDEALDLADAAEVTDHPEPDATVSAPAFHEPGSKERRPAVPNLSSADFELPQFPAEAVADADEEVGQIDFDAVAATDPDQRTQGLPAGQSLSAILRDGLPDDSEEMSTRVRVPSADDETRQPEVSLDYLSESTESSAHALPLQKGPPKARGTKGRPPEPEEAPAKTKPEKVARRTSADDETTEKALPGKKGSGLLIGALVGALAVGGAFAGVYTTGVIPNGDSSSAGTAKPSAPQPGTQQPGPGPAAPVAFDPKAAFAAGEVAKAVEHYKANAPTTLDDKAEAGHVQVFAKAQALPPGGTVAADDPDLKAARANLQEVIGKAEAVGQPGGVQRGVRASVALGVSYELSGDTKGARKVYTDAMDRYPAFKSTFEALIDRLDALEPPAPAPMGTSRRGAPAGAELLLATVLLLQEPPAPRADDVEPGVYYWAAVKAANTGNYKLALEQIDKAKEAHLKRAPAFNGRGINPLSDPREQIFSKSCDELKAYWKLRGAVSGNPDMIAAIQKDGGALAKAIDGFTRAADAAVKAEKEATEARAQVKKLEVEVAKLDKDLKASDKEKIEAGTKLAIAATDLKAAEKKLETAATELKSAEKDVEAKQTALAALVEVLKPVTPVPDKWGPADLLAATKAVVARATGPDLKALVPNAMVAIGGGGLAAGQLVEIAERLNRAETATKEAVAKLMTETKKLKDDHAIELKKLTDTYATDIKKLNNDHAEAVKKLKDGSAEELKKLIDKYAVDSKKLTDDYAAATTKLKQESALALKDEQAKTEAEKKRALARELELQKQLAGAVTPGQVMDLWIPTLTDLRRESDTGPALAAAEKAIAGSSADSEDGAKARTVAGLAHLIRGDLTSAKEMFQAVRRSPAYKAAKGKPWALAADNGLEAVTDPAAPFRRPVVLPPVDLKGAAAALDAGIAAYKNGRNDAAVAALLNATKSNPADPVAWYFLGAARWGQGNEEQARKDFAQGAEREKVSTVPNRTTSEALAPIQGATRDAIDRARP